MEYVKILPVKISPAFVESFEWIQFGIFQYEKFATAKTYYYHAVVFAILTKIRTSDIQKAECQTLT